MTRKTRRFLLLVSIVVFVFLSYVAVLYAQGYKYSFKHKNFVRTGAIYLKANTDAKIYIDNEFAGTTSFFGNSFSKGGLLPGQYKVRVEQDEYTAWEKTISVQEGFLVEFSRIIILSENNEEVVKIIKEIEQLLYPPLPSSLARQTNSTAVANQSSTFKSKPTAIPSLTPNPETTEPFYIKSNNLYRNDIKPDVIADNVVNFALSPDKNKLAWWNGNNEVWVVWLKDADFQPHRKNGDMERIIKFATKIKKIDWFMDDDHIVVDSSGYKIIEIDTRGEVNVIKI